MADWIFEYGHWVRLGFFFGVFGLMALWEVLASRRQLRYSRRRRWPPNIAIVIVGTVLVRLLFPVAAVGVAMIAEAKGWGLLNLFELPAAFEILVAVLLLDLVIYLQHVMFHAVPALWRLHMVHHADQDVDVTTGARFHPIEIVLSMALKMGVVISLGAPALAVFVFEVLLNATSMFNHSNVDLPRSVDLWLRWLVVTPDMHRVHHSVEINESNSNFGFNLPWWDRLLGTYRAQPAAGHEGMKLGVEQLQQTEPAGLMSLLALPFVSPTGRYPISSRSTDEQEPPNA